MSPDKQRRGTVVLVLAGALIAVLILQSWFLPRLVVKRVEKALKIKITGKIQPEFFHTAFHLDGVQTDWNQKIRIFSGRLNVDYDWAALCAGRVALRLQGTQVASELLGDWASLAGNLSELSAGTQKVIFDDIFADLILDARGIREIRALRAESPTIHFSFGPATAGKPPQ